MTRAAVTRARHRERELAAEAMQEWDFLCRRFNARIGFYCSPITRSRISAGRRGITIHISVFQAPEERREAIADCFRQLAEWPEGQRGSARYFSFVLERLGA